jgi:hypothetical protein
MSSGVNDNIQPATWLDGRLFCFLVGLYHARMPNHMTFLVVTNKLRGLSPQANYSVV